MRLLAAFVLVTATTALACTPAPQQSSGEQNADIELRHAHVEHELHEARGTVLWFEPGRLYLNHEEMPGFMDAMAMGFDIRDPSILDGIVPGSDVEFRVVVDADTFYIDQIHAVE